MSELDLSPSQIQAGFSRIGCFVCSPRSQNARGLGLVFEETTEGAQTEFCLDSHFHSYPGCLHGGIVAAILDETMAYASLLKHRLLPFTRSLNLSFRRGVRPDVRYRCLARIEERSDDRFRASSLIRDQAESRLVEATAEFVYPTYAMARRMMPGADLETLREFLRR